MKKSDRKTSVEEAPPMLELVEPLAQLVRNELRAFVFSAGMHGLAQVLEEDREALCGPAYERGREGGPSRAGSALGQLVMGGRRVTVKRPRVRDEHGEVPLPSWVEFSQTDPLEERALEQMVVGVSTRKYRRSLEDVSGDVTERGTSRSAVSRRFKAATAKQLDELLGRDLGALDIVAVLIDGIHIDDHVVLIALGVDGDGRKHVLGLWEGATENHQVALSLLNNLVERGLDSLRSTLFVIDGSKALRKAIRLVFGDHGVVQRCQVHKRRNVLGHLPKAMHASVGKSISDAYENSSAKAAKKRLQTLMTQLETEHPGAAESLREGLEETLTVKRMNLPPSLERTVSTTNAIENLNGGVRDISRRVKRWRGGSMILRWVAAALVERSASFRRLRGYKGMPRLVAFLRENDQALAPELDAQASVA